MTAAALSARASPPQLFDYRPEGARLQQLGRARMDAPRAHAREERREHSHSGAIWRRHCTIFCTPVARVRRRLPVISSIECACIYRTSPRLKVYGSLYMTPGAHDARRNHLWRRRNPRRVPIAMLIALQKENSASFYTGTTHFHKIDQNCAAGQSAARTLEPPHST